VRFAGGGKERRVRRQPESLIPPAGLINRPVVFWSHHRNDFERSTFLPDRNPSFIVWKNERLNSSSAQTISVEIAHAYRCPVSPMWQGIAGKG
jgi:hypothetical protein